MPNDDTYNNMTALYAGETEGINYIKEWYRHRWRYHSSLNNKKENEIFIMAPHGGSIEKGTTELALATAGFTDDFNRHTATSATYDYFIFNGINPPDQNERLHVTASHWDDVVADELVGNSIISLAFHGCTDTQPNNSHEGNKLCLIGGLDEPFKEILRQRISDAGFTAYIAEEEHLNGSIPHNIINRNKRNAGAQFELTSSFRSSLYEVNTRTGRRHSTNNNFWLFVNTIRESVEHYKGQLES